jgi:hypothetical protein
LSHAADFAKITREAQRVAEEAKRIASMDSARDGVLRPAGRTLSLSQGHVPLEEASPPERLHSSIQVRFVI